MTGRIRIIAGRWRGRRLDVPDLPGLRPTGDRVRETLFNWLHAQIHGARCLDLFAGTGALGLEAASRGAARVVLVERDRDLADRLETLAATWPGGEVIEVCRADALGWLEHCEETFDLVFVDPPFADSLQETVLERLSARVLAEHGLIYLESPVGQSVVLDPSWKVRRHKRLGQVEIRLLERAKV